MNTHEAIALGWLVVALWCAYKEWHLASLFAALNTMLWAATA